MSVIIFAPPQPDLSLQMPEVSTMINSFDQPLLARTEDELHNAIERADCVDGFWFIGHSGNSGIVVAEQVLTPAVMGQYLSTAGVEWSYFSSCESALFVDRLQRAYPHFVYAYLTEIADAEAWRTARLIARNYSNVGDIYRAVQMAAPAGTTPLRAFPNPDYRYGGMIMPRGMEDAVGNRLSERMEDLTKALYELKNQMSLLKQEMESNTRSLERRVEQMERGTDVSHSILSRQQASMLIAVLIAIAVMFGIFLVMLATRGALA